MQNMLLMQPFRNFVMRSITPGVVYLVCLWRDRSVPYSRFSSSGAVLFTLFFIVTTLCASAQIWKPAMEGIHDKPSGLPGTAFHVEFRPDGPLGKNWIYGGYFDEDSLRRCVAYREGGRWKPLPFHGYPSNRATDLEMYGDTLYIAGYFRDVVLDKDSSALPLTGLLKWFNDSLWADPQTIYGPMDMSVRGDSLLIWGDGYTNSQDTVFIHFMTTDGGATWQYPYSIVHPTENTPDFGASKHLEILPDGDILTINNGTPRGNPFSGLSRWDGQQWHAYGNGLFGGTSRTFDFEFYKGELYMGGTFNKYDFPDDPANFVARWDGSAWQDLATGITGFVKDLFVYDSILYCSVSGGGNSHIFGDATLPYFAGWNGEQWCGTPFTFGSPPVTFGFIDDTLYVTFYHPTHVDNQPVSFMNYYDGDFLHGPNAVCSTPGLSAPEGTLPEQLFSVYPNPATGRLTIIPTGEEAVHRIRIFDLSGGCVWQSGPPEESASVVMDISHLVPGVYVLEVNGQYRRKVVKM